MLRGIEVAAAAFVLAFGVLLLAGYMASERMSAECEAARLRLSFTSKSLAQRGDANSFSSATKRDQTPNVSKPCAVAGRSLEYALIETTFHGFGNRALGDEILRPQFDRLAVRRAVGGVVPGVAVARERRRVGDALLGDQAFERGEPVPVIGVAGVGIAGGLRALDLLGRAPPPIRAR